jgi:signal transduction histidine kinase
LAITERAIRLHGGTVKAENRPQGGLTIEIRVPILAGKELPLIESATAQPVISKSF